MIKNCKLLSFRELGNAELGYLTPLEIGEDIPFAVNRIYYISDVPFTACRGFHSHRKLEQVLICVKGNVKIRIKTYLEEDIVELNNSNYGLYIGNMVWREMFDFSEDAVLLVFASEHYDESDYIKDYNIYLEESKEYFKIVYENDEREV